MAADKNGASDPYVRLTLGSKKLSSTVKHETLDPIWDEVFEFNGARLAGGAGGDGCV
jgi:Ca2+-dependent lipid-binding protein